MDDYLEIARRGRNAWWRYLASLIVGLLLAMGLCILVLVPLEVSGLAPGLSRQLAAPTQPVAFFLATGVMFASLAACVALAARWIQGKRPGDLIGRWRWRQFGLGVLAWGVVLVLVTLADWALAPGTLTFSATAATPALAAAALVGLVPQVVAEELIFRGLITQGLLLAVRRPWPTALLSGLVFGAMHIPNGWPQAVSATGFGVFTALMAIRTGGLALTTGLHTANNLFGAVVVVSAHDVFRGAPALFTQDAPQLMWLDVCFTLAALALLSLGGIARRRSPQAATGDAPAG